MTIAVWYLAYEPGDAGGGGSDTNAQSPQVGGWIGGWIPGSVGSKRQHRSQCHSANVSTRDKLVKRSPLDENPVIIYSALMLMGAFSSFHKTFPELHSKKKKTLQHYPEQLK